MYIHMQLNTAYRELEFASLCINQMSELKFAVHCPKWLLRGNVHTSDHAPNPKSKIPNPKSTGWFDKEIERLAADEAPLGRLPGSDRPAQEEVFDARPFWSS